jgi:hypothetical protein
MPSDKDWVLLANHSDKTLMRNSLAYYLGDKMNFAYTPRTRHVDLVLNGVYQGNYLLGEHIKVDNDRVDVEKLDADDLDAEVITGGYFLELDDYRDGFVIDLASGLPFVVKAPEDMPDAQVSYIKGYMQQTEDAIFSGNFANPETGYAKFIVPETFIEYYWVQEVLKNIDAKDGSSIFYYKKRGEKLKMGPLWDLDVAAGNASVMTGDDPTSFYVRESKWFKRLFEDPAFKKAADARWATFRDELLMNLPQVIDSFANKLELSQRQNFYKWNVLDQIVWPSPTKLGSYKKEVDYLKNFMMTRIAWIDSQILPEVTSFSLVAPANESRFLVTPDDVSQVKFLWTQSTPESSYDVLIDEVDGDFTSRLAAYSSMDTTVGVPLSGLYGLLAGKDSVTLKWTVVASHDEAIVMASEVFLVKFVNGVLATPQLNVPAINATVDGLTPTIKWLKAYRAEKYDLQISTTEGFETPIVNRTGLPDTNYVITELLTETTKYYWRVRSVREDKQSSWSEVRSFTTPLITGVGEVTYGVSMFPNPTSTELFIEVPSAALVEQADLVDVFGRTAVSSTLLPGATTKIDVSNLQRGMYVVILRGRIERPVTSKVVLR